MTKAKGERRQEDIIDRAAMTGADYEGIVHVAFEAGRESALEEWCAKDGHDESEPVKGKPIKCLRCGNELTEAYWPGQEEVDR